MDISVVIISLLIVGIGALAKKYPNTISGYNTMSRERRRNVDNQAVGNLLYKGFLWIAAAMLVLYFSFRLSGMQAAAFIGFMAPIFLGTPVLMVIAQKYDTNPRGKIAKWLAMAICTLVCVATMAGISVMTVRDSQPTKATIENGAVKFTGIYGVEVPLEDIVKCELWNDIPRITARTNGLGLGAICKGHFTLEGLGKCRLFIRHGDTPYLYIETADGRKIIFNSPDAAYTESLFEDLQRR